MVGCYVLLHPGQIFLLVIYNLTNSYRDKRCVLCIFQAVHRICCGNNFDGLMFLHTARFFSKILLWVILTRWAPCIALRLNIDKIKRREYYYISWTLKGKFSKYKYLDNFSFKLSQNAIKIFWKKFIKHNHLPMNFFVSRYTRAFVTKWDLKFY